MTGAAQLARLPYRLRRRLGGSRAVRRGGSCLNLEAGEGRWRWGLVCATRCRQRPIVRNEVATTARRGKSKTAPKKNHSKNETERTASKRPGARGDARRESVKLML